MIQLATNYSDSLVELIESNSILIDAVQVGERFSIEQIRRYQKSLPGLQFYFHANRLGVTPGTTEEFKMLLGETHSPWASVHIALLPSYLVLIGLRFGWYLPSPNPERLMKEYIKRVTSLSGLIDMPLLLENMPSFSHRGYEYEADPNRITTILETTNCNLLLDISHARIAAQIRNMDVYDYLGQLPLNRTRQMHVSGSRMRNGYLYDAHSPLDETDYSIIKWTLARTQPKMLTLEYWKERESLREQLLQLRSILDGITENG